MTEKLTSDFFNRDCLAVAADLIGKLIVRKFDNGEIRKFRITETEAYRGEEDLACHASKGKTTRTEVMYQSAGKIYVYLIYGMYWMLNVVTSHENYPAAVLIRGIEEVNGPGRLGKLLELNKSFYGLPLDSNSKLWIEEDGTKLTYEQTSRVGIDYAGPIWANKPWRFKAK